MWFSTFLLVGTVKLEKQFRYPWPRNRSWWYVYMYVWTTIRCTYTLCKAFISRIYKAMNLHESYLYFYFLFTARVKAMKLRLIGQLRTIRTLQKQLSETTSTLEGSFHKTSMHLLKHFNTCSFIYTTYIHAVRVQMLYLFIKGYFYTEILKITIVSKYIQTIHAISRSK